MSLWTDIWAWLASRRGGSAGPELLAQNLIGVRCLRAEIAPSQDGVVTERLRTIDSLITASTQNAKNWQSNWRKVWEAERLMSGLLGEATLAVELRRRLDEAKVKSIAAAPGLEAHLATIAQFAAVEKLQAMRALHAAVLEELHWSASRSWLDRTRRKRAAFWIILSALALTLLALLPNLQLWLSKPIGEWMFGLASTSPSAHRYGLYIAVSFGLLGALFSRLSVFQASYKDLSYERVVSEFLGSLIFIRLLFGMIGSIVLYYAVYGKLIGGELFPDATKLRFDPATLPGPDLAKLVVWSFIGGFSERLIPEFIQRSEATAAKADRPNI
jgi:hypothetical protein